jgi:hypothetical protein
MVRCVRVAYVQHVNDSVQHQPWRGQLTAMRSP